MTLVVPLSQLLGSYKQLQPHRLEDLTTALDTSIYLAESIRRLGKILLENLRWADNLNVDAAKYSIEKFRQAGGVPIDLRLMSANFELSVARNRKAMDTLHSAGYADQKLFDELAERMGAARLCSSIFTKLADLMEEV